MPPIALEGFDWNHGNLTKSLRHGVSIEEIGTALLGGAMLILPEVKHSNEEDRLIATGLAATGRHIFVAFTARETAGRMLLRPVSARCMHKREIRTYGQARTEIANR